MANVRLYREIYCVAHSSFTGETYTLINPVQLTADVFINGTSTLIESPTVQNESTGIFFVELNSVLYEFANIYLIKWNVKYTVNSPVKILPTRFRFNPINIGSDITIELFDNSIFI